MTDSGSQTGSKSITITVVAGTNTPPATPAGLTVTKQASGVALVQWQDKSDNESGFEIDRQKLYGFFWGDDVILSAAAGATQLSDSAGTPVFRYRVRALNAGNHSDWSGWFIVRLL